VRTLLEKLKHVQGVEYEKIREMVILLRPRHSRIIGGYEPNT
jgi:hypothetical protein